MSSPPTRVLLIEVGDGGVPAGLLGRMLRDEGMEVVYAGPLDGVEQIIRTAEQEDPGAIGIVVGPGADPSMLTGLPALLPGRRLFVLGAVPDEAARHPARVFETADAAVAWLAGVRSHTSEAPSDRAR